MNFLFFVRSHERFLLSLICLIFLVSPVSALDWDNSISYENDSMKVILENVWGLPIIGDEIGVLDLKSHSSIDEVKKVGLGENVVMFYDFSNFKEVYYNGLGDVSFFDVETGELVKRKWSFVYLVNQSYESPLYVCDKIYNLKNDSYSDFCVEKGFEIKFKETWLPYNSRDIPTENIRIGILVNVLKDDLIDGVWKVGGELITAHAVWDEDLDTDLRTYYKFDDNLATTVVYDELESDNGASSTNTENLYYSSGLVESCFDFTPASSEYLSSFGSLNLASDWSLSFWFNSDDLGGTGLDENYLIDTRTGAYQVPIRLYIDGTDLKLTVETPSTSWTETLTPTSFSTGTWYHVAIIHDTTGKTLKGYIDNTLEGTLTYTGTTSSSTFLVGTREVTTRHYDGKLDEFGIWDRELTTDEITQLYNSGDGITWSECTEVFLNTSWSSWSNNESCGINDSLTQMRWAVTYDSSFCGLTANVTIYDFQEDSCDYCSYSLINTSWSSWANQTSCLINDTYLENRSLVEYDEDYSTCYAVTGIATDLWNGGDNITWWEYNEDSCDYCTPSLINTSWSSWSNDSVCLVGDYVPQTRSLVQYDSNACGEVSNITFYEYQNESCTYIPCVNAPTNTSWSSWIDIESCQIDNTTAQSRFIITYDSNESYCGNFTNFTTYEYQDVACVYTAPDESNQFSFSVDFEKEFNLWFLFGSFAVAIACLFFPGLSMASIVILFADSFLMLFSGIWWVWCLIPLVASVLIGGSRK